MQYAIYSALRVFSDGRKEGVLDVLHDPQLVVQDPLHCPDTAFAHNWVYYEMCEYTTVSLELLMPLTSP